MFRELKVEPLWKLKQERRRWRFLHVILPKVILAILAGILIAMLILGVTEPRDASAMVFMENKLITGPGIVVLDESIPETVSETEAESEPEPETVQETESQPEMEFIGTFTLTAYCSCRKCCGKWSGGPTASGAMPEAGKTIAVDKSVIPLGTKVYIEGYGEYVAQDTGSKIKGNRVDVYMDSHEAAKNFADGAGSCKRDVYIIKE